MRRPADCAGPTPTKHWSLSWRRPPAAGLGLAQGLVVLGRVGHVKLRAVQSGQTPPPPVGLWVPPPVGQRTQHPPHQLGEHLLGQPRASMGASALVETVWAEQGEMFGQSSGGVHDVEDQRTEQRHQGHAGLTPPPMANVQQGNRPQQFVKGSQKTRAGNWLGGSRFGWLFGSLMTCRALNRTLGMYSHSKGKYMSPKFVPGKNC